MTLPLPEAWLRGPVAGIDPALMPAAHALIQAGEEIERAAAPLDEGELWATPGGAASVAFHLRHIAGSIDRLLAYARGETLTPAQGSALHAESQRPDPAPATAQLVSDARAAIDRALGALRAATPDGFATPRGVGRAQLPSTVLGLLGHIADHTTRHAGQIVTTSKIVRGTRGARPTRRE